MKNLTDKDLDKVSGGAALDLSKTTRRIVEARKARIEQQKKEQEEAKKSSIKVEQLEDGSVVSYGGW